MRRNKVSQKKNKGYNRAWAFAQISLVNRYISA